MLTAGAMNGRGFDWGSFRGSADGLKWNRRDLATIDRVLAYVPGRTACVQAGGNLGIWPKRLAQVFATVYTFEPDPHNFACLCYNAPEPNIIKLQAALGPSHRLVGLCHQRRDGKPSNHEGITHVSGDGMYPQLCLDDLALPVCDLVYLDIEGGELAALAGAADTLRTCRPVVALEMNKNMGFVQVTEADVHRFFQGVRYREHERVSESDRVFLPEERRG